MDSTLSHIDEEVPGFELTDGRAPEGAIEAFSEFGVVCLRSAFSSDWLDVVEQGISAALSGASTDYDEVKIKDDKGSFSFSSQAWKEVEPFRRFIFESPLADMVWPFLKSDTLNLFYDFLLIKQARSDSASTPWHQDQAYYPLTGTKMINCWTALDPIPKETSLRFLAGSHAPPVVHQAVNFENPSKDYKHVRKERTPVPNIDANHNATILCTALEPGDMLIWSSYTFHSAPGNRLDRRRAAFSVNWAGDDIRYDDAAALETYRHPDLRTGDKITCDKFPLVRQR